MDRNSDHLAPAELVGGRDDLARARRQLELLDVPQAVRAHASASFEHERVIEHESALRVDVEPTLRPSIEKESIIAVLGEPGPPAANRMGEAEITDSRLELAD